MIQTHSTYLKSNFYCRDNHNTCNPLSRHFTIAGQKYELRIIPNPLLNRVWRFELQNLNPLALIPGGFKLRLLTEIGQDFEDNFDYADTAVAQLWLDVEIYPEEGIIVEFQPIPNNYIPEIFWF